MVQVSVTKIFCQSYSESIHTQAYTHVFMYTQMHFITLTLSLTDTEHTLGMTHSLTALD